jgi:hypothetical protein
VGSIPPAGTNLGSLSRPHMPKRKRPAVASFVTRTGGQSSLVELSRLSEKKTASTNSPESPTVLVTWAQNPHGTIIFSTTVPLTPVVPKPILHGIGISAHPSGRRKLIERMGRDGVYRFETGSFLEMLDIGVLTDRMPPGLVHPLEAQCHANSRRLFSLPCSYWPGQWV